MGALAYFLSWSTYGTWLPGDARGWVDRHRSHGEVVDAPDPAREAYARKLMRGKPVRFDRSLRAIVRESLEETARYRGWRVHFLDVRSNHVHIVVSAGETPAGEVMRVLKAYASRKLNRLLPARVGPWWTRQGSKRFLFTDEDVAHAVWYVQNQDITWMKHL